MHDLMPGTETEVHGLLMPGLMPGTETEVHGLMPGTETEMHDLVPDTETGAKRGNEFEDGDAVIKRSKSDNVRIRLLILGRHIGGIIGKGGENITRLRKQYNVDANIPTTRTNDRVLTVGGSLDDVIAVVKEILPNCTEAPYSVNQKNAYEINILVHTEEAGFIIGKGGSKIKEIREGSNGKVKVYSETLPNSNDRVIAIGGDTDCDVITALAIILNLLNGYPKRISRPYQPSSGISGGGMTGSGFGISQNILGNDGFGDGGYSFKHASVGNIGGPVPLMGMMGIMGKGGGNTPDQNDFLRFQTVTSITVPNDVCGAIIGRAGTRIREIRGTSGAMIKFSESEKDSVEDRIITITGTQKQVQIAEKLMTECVRTRIDKTT